MAVKSFSCECGGGFGNIGLPSCVKRAGLLVKDYFHSSYKSDGTRNSILATDFVDGKLPTAYILAKLMHPDPTQRWYPTPDAYEEAAPSRTDRTEQTSSTGTIKILRNGQIGRSFELWEVPHNWSAKINRATCNEVSTYSIDESGAMIGEVNTDGSEFYGLLLQKGTLNAQSFEASADKAAYTMITYQISRESVEGCFLTIDSSQIEGNLKSAKSLIEVDLTQELDNVGGNPNTNTEIYVNALNSTLGTFNNFHALKGAIDLSDWKVFTSSGLLGAEIVISMVEELEDGKYRITLAADPATEVYVSYVKVGTSISGFSYVADQVKITKP